MADAPCVFIAHPSPDLYGSDRVVIETAAGFRAGGWRVVVTLPTPGPLVKELQDRDCEVVIAPTVVLRKAMMRPRGLIVLIADLCRFAIPSWRQLGRSGADVVVVNTVTVPLWLLLARLQRKTIVAHVHEAEEDVSRLIGFLLAAPLLLADVVVANSGATARVLGRSLSRLSSRIQVIYNGVVGPAEQPLPPRSVLTDPVRLVLVGRLSPRKGTDVAIEAVGLLRDQGTDVQLNLVGSVFAGYEWYLADLVERVSHLKIADRVCFAGFTPDVWGAYAAADIALVPSRVEPFGNAAIEAQLARRPVVVSSTQGLVETVGGGEFGLLCRPDDPVALAEAVTSLIAGWSDARDVAESAQIEATVRFSPARYQRDLVELAQRVCAERPGCARS